MPKMNYFELATYRSSQYSYLLGIMSLPLSFSWDLKVCAYQMGTEAGYFSPMDELITCGDLDRKGGEKDRSTSKYKEPYSCS